MPEINTVQQWENVTKEIFEEQIIPSNQPAVLKGLVKHWPVVRQAAEPASTNDTLDFLSDFDSQQRVYTIVSQSEVKGRFFYNKDLNGVNFDRLQATFSDVLQQLKSLIGVQNPPSIAVQAANIRSAMNGFEAQHPMALLGDDIEPTMWLNNRAFVAPHYDTSDNVACVCAGQRRFTLFPPEQISNLYVGPAMQAPGGVPISLVDYRDYDSRQYPKFAQALEHAQQATLEAGDAIYIPSPWWHGVESLSEVNLLVNYWFNGASISPNNALLHCLLSMSGLSDYKRKSWQHLFDYYAFHSPNKPANHLPESVKDILTSINNEQKTALIDFLKQELSQSQAKC